MSKYSSNMQSFRATLQHTGLDLDAERQFIQMAAQGWAAQKWSQVDGQDQTRPIGNATYNQRIATLSSWYEFVIHRELVAGIERNPIKALERRKTDDYQGAQPLVPEDVQQALERIDRDTLTGERDYQGFKPLPVRTHLEWDYSVLAR